jgi:hypothetical protein
MRVIQVPEQADILVSELLGSFGDNELSPECLDGAMRFLKRTWAGRMFLIHLFANHICSNWNIYTILLHRTPRSTFIFKVVQ